MSNRHSPSVDLDVTTWEDELEGRVFRIAHVPYGVSITLSIMPCATMRDSIQQAFMVASMVHDLPTITSDILDIVIKGKEETGE